jgi:p38 MAP kinase
MLVPNPSHRICAADAVAHKYLSQYHDPTYEPITTRFSDWPSDKIQPSTDIWNMMM